MKEKKFFSATCQCKIDSTAAILVTGAFAHKQFSVRASLLRKQCSYNRLTKILVSLNEDNRLNYKTIYVSDDFFK